MIRSFHRFDQIGTSSVNSLCDDEQMYKPTSSQRSLFEIDNNLPDRIKRLLKESWAEGFARKVLPVLLAAEDEFSVLYCSDNGRPNWSIARMLGISILQEMQNLDDQAALNCLSFDVRWHHALGLSQDEAYLSRRSLVDFRSRMVAVDPEMNMLRSVFDKVGAEAIAELEISTDEQRLDSTIITSNICTYGRLDLFKKTLCNFLSWLSKNMPDKFSMLATPVREWFSSIEENQWFGAIAKMKKNKRKELVTTLATWMYEVEQLFKNDENIKNEEAYMLVQRLLMEQCKIIEPENSDDENPSDDDTSDGAQTPDENSTDVLVKVIGNKTNPGSCLQSPFDPDAGCGHKGPGYHVHVSETCNNRSKEILTDYFVVPAGVVDSLQAEKALDNLMVSNKQPKVLFMDAGYNSPKQAFNARMLGTEFYRPISSANMRENAITRSRFKFDERGYCVSCPTGHAPLHHDYRTSSGKPEKTLHAYFSGEKCEKCFFGERCMTRPPNNKNGIKYHLEIEPYLVAKDHDLDLQKEDIWWDRYQIRSGIEATMSELKRSYGLGKLRVRRKPRVDMAVSLKCIACNVKRWVSTTGAGTAQHLFVLIVITSILVRRHKENEYRNRKLDQAVQIFLSAVILNRIMKIQFEQQSWRGFFSGIKFPPSPLFL